MQSSFSSSGTLVHDAIVIGAGASGTFCAKFIQGSCIVLEKAIQATRKVLVSGGGRCNFTNKNIAPEHYYTQNVNFCRSAFASCPPEMIVEIFAENGINSEEREGGKIFANDARCVSDFLQFGAQIIYNIEAAIVDFDGRLWHVTCTNGRDFLGKNLVIATGGLSIPELEVSDFGYRFAEKMNLQVEPLAPALVRLDFPKEIQKTWGQLSGIAVPAEVTVGSKSIRGDVLLTHYGLSGPAILTASLWWRDDERLEINWLPHVDLEKEAKDCQALKVKSFLSKFLPQRLAEFFAIEYPLSLANMDKRSLSDLFQKLKRFTFTPKNLAGYRKAEVTRGGVSTRGLSSKTMEAKAWPGLYFIGEVVDMTGELGGYNLHWAWASALLAAQNINRVN